MNSNPIKTDGFSGKIDSLSNFLFNRLENWKIVLINVLYWFTANLALKNRSYVAIFIDIRGQTTSGLISDQASVIQTELHTCTKSNRRMGFIYGLLLVSIISPIYIATAIDFLHSEKCLFVQKILTNSKPTSNYLTPT